MTRIILTMLVGASLILPLSVLGQEKTPPPKEDDPAASPSKADYTEFNKVLHKMVSAQLPRVYEDATGWGGTIPVPGLLRLPRIKRTYIQVGDRVEMPHGLWKRFRVWIEDPAQDLQIQVRELKQSGPTTYRISVEAEALVKGETDWQMWLKGIGAPAVTADADAVVNLLLDCDVNVSLNTSKFPPEIVIDPKVASSKLDLKDFRLKRVGEIVVLQGEVARNLGNELKGTLAGLVRSQEEPVKDLLNQAIAQSLKNGKGNLSAGALLKALSATKK